MRDLTACTFVRLDCRRHGLRSTVRDSFNMPACVVCETERERNGGYTDAYVAGTADMIIRMHAHSPLPGGIIDMARSAAAFLGYQGTRTEYLIMARVLHTRDAR